jgi:hypothetical protein
MDFQKVDAHVLLTEFVELQAIAVDKTSVEVAAQVRDSVSAIRSLDRTPTSDDLATALRENPQFLDVCRLFMCVSQETAAHIISEKLPVAASWTTLKKMAKKNPDALAKGLAETGLPTIIHAELSKAWTIEDVLLERYNMSRGRAIAGQNRGRSLEDKVETILKGIAPFEKRVTFIGRENKTAKCDIAIPTRKNPKIIIEAKGFEATGSKLTDFLGDIGKIIDAKESRMYFFVVTDGRGWSNRKSDLQHVVEKQHQKYIDMIYTTSRLDQLAKDVRYIWEREVTPPSGQ